MTILNARDEDGFKLIKYDPAMTTATRKNLDDKVMKSFSKNHAELCGSWHIDKDSSSDLSKQVVQLVPNHCRLDGKAIMNPYPYKDAKEEVYTCQYVILHGDELCLKPDDDKPLVKRKVYLRETNDGRIAVTYITSAGRTLSDIVIDIKAPQPFTLENLKELKKEIFEATSKAGQVSLNEKPQLRIAEINHYFLANQAEYVIASGDINMKIVERKKGIIETIEFDDHSGGYFPHFDILSENQLNHLSEDQRKKYLEEFLKSIFDYQKSVFTGIQEVGLLWERYKPKYLKKIENIGKLSWNEYLAGINVLKEYQDNIKLITKEKNTQEKNNTSSSIPTTSSENKKEPSLECNNAFSSSSSKSSETVTPMLSDTEESNKEPLPGSPMGSRKPSETVIPMLSDNEESEIESNKEQSEPRSVSSLIQFNLFSPSRASVVCATVAVATISVVVSIAMGMNNNSSN